MKASRIIAVLLVLCMFATVLLACNSEADGTSGTTGTIATSGTTGTTGNNNSNNNNNNNNNNGGNSGNTNVTPNVPEIDENKLVSYVDAVDTFNGDDFDEDNIDLGQGSYMNVMKNATLEEYNSFKKQLEDEGAVLYTTNKIGNNLFATYISRSQIINVMFLAFDYDENDTANYPVATAIDHNEVRVVIDERPAFDLPLLADDNKYTVNESVEPKLILLSDDAVYWPGRMGFLYQLADGSFFIIDGGYWGAGENPANPNPTSKTSMSHTIINVMKEHAPDPDNIVVAGWFFSHIHEDHIGAFLDIALNPEYKDLLTIETVIYNMPTDAEMDYQNAAGILKGYARRLEEAISILKPANVVKAHAGQKFFVRDLIFDVYMSQTELLYSTNVATGANHTSIHWHNDTSVVIRVQYQNTTAIYLGDTHVNANKFVTNPLYRNELECDILQVAHHGYGDTGSGIIYKHLKTPPKMVLWPDMRGHYDAKNPNGTDYYENGKLYGGVLYVGFNQQYLVKDGVTQVYVTDNTCAVITDFVNLNSYKMHDYVK